MDIIKNNKLIAEFMGWKYYDNLKGLSQTEQNWVWELPKEFMSVYIGHNSIPSSCISSARLIFHSSWDWLIPVVEKIEELNYCVFIHQNCCKIQGAIMGDRTIVSINMGSNYMEENSKLSNTYKSVIEFIKWYNQNK